MSLIGNRSPSRPELAAETLEDQISWWHWRYQTWISETFHLSKAGTVDPDLAKEIIGAGQSCLSHRLEEIELLCSVTLPDSTDPSAGDEISQMLDLATRMHTEVVSKKHTAERFFNTLVGLYTKKYVAQDLSPQPIANMVKADTGDEKEMFTHIEDLASSLDKRIWSLKNQLEKWVTEFRAANFQPGVQGR